MTAIKHYQRLQTINNVRLDRLRRHSKSSPWVLSRKPIGDQNCSGCQYYFWEAHFNGKLIFNPYDIAEWRMIRNTTWYVCKLVSTKMWNNCYMPISKRKKATRSADAWYFAKIASDSFTNWVTLITIISHRTVRLDALILPCYHLLIEIQLTIGLCPTKLPIQ